MSERFNPQDSSLYQKANNGTLEDEDARVGIGRLVLNPEAFTSAQEYLRRRTPGLPLEVLNPFLYLLAAKDMSKDESGGKFTRTHAQAILDTLPDHPDYIPSYATTDLECVVKGLSVRSNHQGKICRIRYMVDVQEQYYVGRLQRERAMLLGHAGVELTNPEDLKLRLRIAMLRRARNESSVACAMGQLLPECVTLGPIQLEPVPEAKS